MKFLSVKNIYIICFVFFLSIPSNADEKSILKGEKIWKERINCSYCHGPFGNGAGNPRSPGKAANLRETQLDKAGLIEIINCGIPTTEMPYFHRAAYKDAKICWDMTAEDMGEDMPKKGKKTLSDKSVAALADYIIAKIKGRGKITTAECEEYFSVGSRRCDGFREREKSN
ncbi:MAG: cytochrome C [Pelagibacteraceae bacterium]|nr:cytochrome C [Pelagibacteraceae bacterium]|tara:strand:+ start:145 stop:657 length:513 start_codon:yes stop_codon:yes gene_type:complete